MGKPDKRYAGSWKLRGHGDIEALTDDAEKVRHEIESLSDKAGWVGLTAKDRVRIAELSKMDSTPNAKLGRLLKLAEKDLRKGHNLSPLFVNTNKMDKYLSSLK